MLKLNEIVFREDTVNNILQKLPKINKDNEFIIIDFNKNNQVFTNTLDVYDYFLMDIHNEIQQKIRETELKELAKKQKLKAKKEVEQQTKKLEFERKLNAEKESKRIKEAQKRDFEIYGNASPDERKKIDLSIRKDNLKEQHEINKHNERITYQVEQQLKNDISTYDKKYLTLEVAQFEKLENDAKIFKKEGVLSDFLNHYHLNYSNKLSSISLNDLVDKILIKSSKRNIYISKVIMDAKQKLKNNLK